MVFNLRSSRLAIGLAARAALVGILTLLAVELFRRGGFYATSLIVAAIAVLVVLDLWREISRTDARLAQFLDGLAADAFERPARPPPGFTNFGEALDRAIGRLQATREARQRSLDHLQGLLDTVSAALIVMEPDGTVSLANAAARRLAGREVQRLEDIEALGPVAQELATLRRGGRRIIRLADGRQVLALLTLFTAPGEPQRRLISLQSIAGELDAVEQKAWRDLVRILSHEMMNSLTPIVSLSESLRGRVGPEGDVAEAVEVIARRSAGLMSFVDRYRKVADLPTPRLKPVRLSVLVADVDRLMSTIFAEERITYLSTVEPPDLVALADSDLLEQAVINLLKNAKDAVLGREQASVFLSCCEDQGRISISVADNGPGVPPHITDEIFVPFYSTKPGGSGVGLSLARQIAVAHSGQLELTANPRGGTVFRLLLPS